MDQCQKQVGMMYRSMIYPRCGYDCDLSPRCDCLIHISDVSRLRSEIAEIRNDLVNERRRLGWLKGLADGMLALFWFSLFGFMLYCLVLGVITFIGGWNG